MKHISSQYSSSSFGRVVVAVLILGALIRLLFWGLSFPYDRMNFIFNPKVVDIPSYLLSFESSHEMRMPLHDVLAYGVHLLSAPLVGIRSASVFNVLLSISSLPLFYLGVTKLFDRRTGLFAVTFYAFYPKVATLSAGAYPESVSASFAAMSLYPLALAVETDRPLVALGAGTTATLSFLMFDPAVMFLGLSILFFYAVRASSLIDRSAIDRPFGAYAAPGIVTMVAYLILGPIAIATRMINGTGSGYGHGSRDLFLNPESLSLIEKSGRFVLYSFVDFWWHNRGFDTEESILGDLVPALSSVMGEFVWVYFAGLGVIWILFTIPVLLGMKRATTRKTAAAGFVLSWFTVYLLAHLGLNLGWEGAFQTRHVFPVFPAIAILFGLGAGAILDAGWLDTTLFAQFTTENKLLALGGVLFAVLVINGAVHHAMVYDRKVTRHIEPAGDIDALVEADEEIAISLATHDGINLYQDLVLYAPTHIHPTVFKNGSEKTRWALAGSRIVRGGPNKLAANTDRIDYVAVKSSCDPLNENQRRFVGAALEAGGQIVHNETTAHSLPQHCTVRTVVVEI